MSEMTYKVVRTEFGYHYRGVNIRKIVGTRVFFQYGIVKDSEVETSIWYTTIEQATRSIDAVLDSKKVAQ